MKKKLSLKDLLISAGEDLRRSFEYTKSTTTHSGIQGSEAEDILKRFLNERLPKRFDCSSGHIVDMAGSISKQCDVIIYDALNSPIYKPSKDGMIILSDNAACAIEVKSTLNKKELEKAAKNIASVKKLKKSPITDMDEPVTNSSFINTKTYGVVFAYESDTNLSTLAENLKEINNSYPSREWIDMVVVLDKGIIGYTVQNPFDPDTQGWFGGPSDDEFPVPPFYVHLAISELGNLTLNKFFVDLLAHLTFYRRRVGFDFNSLLGPEGKRIMTINAYQYNLERNLLDVTDDHKKENFNIPIRYILFKNDDKTYVGQIGAKTWQDGLMISYSGFVNPKIIFSLFVAPNENAVYVKGMKEGNHWVSSILSLSSERFENIAKNIDKLINGVVSQKDMDDDDPMTAIKYREEEKG